ncbi:hypothetical protein AVEN_47424-1 [Araneus ventricosus]|uniref:Uncharacterized protein n=1 Tax=Araneus ventricosus TaxID=182803 RepID=A0A4Y2KS32_ARAVE|nr:hypothetical protein AVEN_47424-1 [Araneus ventricosus]
MAPVPGNQTNSTEDPPCMGPVARQIIRSGQTSSLRCGVEVWRGVSAQVSSSSPDGDKKWWTDDPADPQDRLENRVLVSRRDYGLFKRTPLQPSQAPKKEFFEGFRIAPNGDHKSPDADCNAVSLRKDGDISKIYYVDPAISMVINLNECGKLFMCGNQNMQIKTCIRQYNIILCI